MNPLSNSLTTGINKPKLIIIASNVLGAESVSNHGFDWKYLPITIESLNLVLENWMAMEIEWCNRIAMWKTQGAVDDDVVAEPGALIWLVELKNSNLDLSVKDGLSLSTLLQIANKAALTPVHIECKSDIDLCANKILLKLKDIEPIQF
jgi:hypothetical protein